MTEHSLWRFAREFHRALSERRTDQLGAVLDKNVDWAIYGPINAEVFHVFEGACLARATAKPFYNG